MNSKHDQPKGTKHEPKTRRTLSGKTIPADTERVTWHDLVLPGPPVKAPEPVDPPTFVTVSPPLINQASRRARRTRLIAQAKKARRERRNAA